MSENLLRSAAFSSLLADRNGSVARRAHAWNMFWSDYGDKLLIFCCQLEYRLISKKGEGTFSEVLKAQSIKTGKYVAIKCMKNHFDNIEQVNNLREIQALRRLSPHPQIIKLYEVL